MVNTFSCQSFHFHSVSPPWCLLGTGAERSVGPAWQDNQDHGITVKIIVALGPLTSFNSSIG